MGMDCVHDACKVNMKHYVERSLLGDEARLGVVLTRQTKRLVALVDAVADLTLVKSLSAQAIQAVLRRVLHGVVTLRRCVSDI